jgi:hypothetical protein
MNFEEANAKMLGIMPESGARRTLYRREEKKVRERKRIKNTGEYTEL